MRQLNFYDRLASVKASRLDRSSRRSKPYQFWYRIIRNRMRLLVIIGMLSSAGLGGSIWLLKHENKTLLTTTGLELFTFASTKLGITIENVYSVGHRESKPEAILTALGINRGDPILAFQPHKARNRILDLTWVEKASVERHLPNTIRINILERRPFALWQHEKQAHLIDRHGTIIAVQNIHRFSYLPLIVGKGAPKVAPQLFQAVRHEKNLYDNLSSAVWVGARRWDLHLDNGLIIHLPEQNTSDAIVRLSNLLAQSKINEKNISSIDLRLPDRVTLSRRQDHNSNDPTTTGKANVL